MTQLLIAIALICQLKDSSRPLYTQNLQRRCVSEIWLCIKEKKYSIDDRYGECINPGVKNGKKKEKKSKEEN